MDPLQAGDPERMGPYRLLGRLGTGGQGTVYLAEGPSGTPVAVKALNAASSSDPVGRRRFASEAALIRQVSSFCVAEVLDADLDSERPYIVSEYVEGPSLRAAVSAEGPRGGGALRRLAIGTVTALAAIHQGGVVHRDFKPPNVLLGPDGPRVIDFGIARLLDTATTTTGQVIGTVAYMSPEQVSGARVGFASDMFGWAATMAYAASGRPPFGQDSVPAVMYRILHADPELPALPDDLGQVVRECLSKDPELRPAAREVLLRLIGDDGTGGGGPPPTRWETRTRPAVPPSSPDGQTTAVSGETALLPGEPAAGAGSTRRLRADPALPGGTRARRWTWGAAAVLLALLVTVAVVTLRPGSGDPATEVAGASLYRDDFNERTGWDGYTFNPDAPAEERTYRGYEIDRGVFSLRADSSYPSNPVLSPVPAKTPVALSSAERDVLIGATAQVREGSTGTGALGLLCWWDENVPNGYRFLLGLDGTARITRTARGNRLDVAPAVQTDAPGVGQTVRLQAACRRTDAGARLTLWVDGAQVIDATDSQALPDAGNSQAGLVAQVPESGAGVLTVSFDDFSVHRAR
ncbi:serine/threonine protein kinase [Planomonospora sp. ID67723]|uniref:serine/threonine-protein kinase n=1 Tax=Planomonospora sp. ID67723 TaxID=2738134 RepID=UPI0018C43B8F|nr:serine/threonine-protein kinase [Planomonospora sp. ID67723]MBG0828015.1 serine/threonine protein kinase [Planomonospora sp. ID67723]